MSQNNISPAGRNAGKRINIVPRVQDAYALLVKAADRNNHWAKVAVNMIHGMSSGRDNSQYVYVRPGPIVTRGREEFFVTLPGCKATMERRSNDQYYLMDLTFDDTYSAINSPTQATGLHKAQKEGKSWDTTFYKNGQTDASGNEIRITAITDGNHANAKAATITIAASIAKAPDAPSSKKFIVMDVHYTHGTGKHGGLLSRKMAKKPLDNGKIHGSAILLSKSMMGAKDKNITWVSEKGGSAVLTQALEIVSKNNVRLKKHNVFLYDPTTSTNQALQAARRAGIELDRYAVHTGMFNPMGNSGQVTMLYNRVKSDKGYTIGNAAFDLVSHVGKGKSASGLAISALGVAGIATSMPAIAGISGALGVAGGALAAVKMGETLVSNIAPHFYNKHAGKIR